MVKHPNKGEIEKYPSIRQPGETWIMNRKQFKILLCCIVTIILMGVFPPVFGSYVVESSADKPLPSLMAYGIDACSDNFYGFLLTVPTSNIRFGTLFVQWSVVVAITGVLLYVFRSKKAKVSMSKRDTYMENQKVRSSKLAIFSLLLPLLVIAHYFLTVVLTHIFYTGSVWEDLVSGIIHLTFYVTFTLPLGLILGTLALDEIKESGGQLKGRIKAIIGIAIGAMTAGLIIILMSLVTPDLGPK